MNRPEPRTGPTVIFGERTPDQVAEATQAAFQDLAQQVNERATDQPQPQPLPRAAGT